jgi:hypothetical protein
MYVRGLVNQRAIMLLEKLGKLRKFSDFIRTRTSDFPSSVIVPQPINVKGMVFMG